ncbi:hypothetical protein CTAYLR_000474 [Chrysophaeum taylorii]|uniref:Protein YIPF n=1 Tax=Chrysophaeum taylorii TaxID=2483200 RepID=A0AAD7UFZ4_9STRA|nr:hypothetical protein CTAYLR_000474 [Chrysophaeum taylorii]
MCACLSVEYYRPFFDINTDEVVARIRYALVFCGTGSPFLDVVREKPDAYGPWWISTTLVFLIAVTSHLKTLMQFSGQHYRYDFKVVTFAAMTVYTYLGFAALAIWLALNYWLKTPLTILQCACVVGYSLSVYVPASILCVFSIISWPALLAAWVLSSLFAVKSILPIIEHHEKQMVAIFAGGLVSINCGLMLIIKLELYS